MPARAAKCAPCSSSATRSSRSTASRAPTSQQFDAMGKAFAQMAKDAGLTWRRIPLDLSFRTVAPVLAAVDSVFADHARTPGLSSEAAIVRHAVHRLGHGGLVEMWPTEKRRRRRQRRPVDAARRERRRARRPSGWPSASPTPSAAGSTAARCWPPRAGRITAGDILILVRKRRPFAGPMVARPEGARHRRRRRRPPAARATRSPSRTSCRSANSSPCRRTTCRSPRC